MMKIISRLLIALALLSTGSLALAEQNHGQHNRHDSQRSSSHRGEHDRGRHGDRDRHDRRQDRRSDRRHYERRYSYRHAPPRHYRPIYRPVYRSVYRPVYRYPAPRYVVRHDRWARGHRYYGPNYVVSNYGDYRLRAPRRGSHWVRANNDYLLVAIATGVILDIALH